MTDEARPRTEAGKPWTKAGRLLLMAGLTFHSGRRLADSPELIAAIEAEAAIPDSRLLNRLRDEFAARLPLGEGRWLHAFDEAAAVLSPEGRQEPDNG